MPVTVIRQRHGRCAGTPTYSTFRELNSEPTAVQPPSEPEQRVGAKPHVASSAHERMPLRTAEVADCGATVRTMLWVFQTMTPVAVGRVTAMLKFSGRLDPPGAQERRVSTWGDSPQ